MSDFTQDFRPISELVQPVEVKITTKKDPAKPYIGLESMPSRGANLLGWSPASSSISTNSVFSRGDVLFGKLRPNLRKCVIAPFDGYCSTDILVLRAKDGIDYGFAGKVLQTEQVGAAAERTAIGTKMPRTSWKHLKTVAVFCPDIKEQKFAAQILDTLDTAIRETEALIDKLKAIKQGLLHDLLTRGIDANGQMRPAQSEAPQLYKESPLGWIPREWESPSLANICAGIGDGVHYAVERSNEGVPFLFVSCIRNGKINWHDASFVSQKTYQEISKRSKPVKGMVLLTVVGSYGHAAHVDDECDFGFERNIAFLIPNSRYLHSKYLLYSISSETTRAQVERLVIGNAQKVLTLSALNSIILPLPSLTEQAKIFSRLDALTERQEHEMSTLEKLSVQKKGLTDDLLTGRVRVTSLLKSMQQAAAPTEA